MQLTAEPLEHLQACTGVTVRPVRLGAASMAAALHTGDIGGVAGGEAAIMGARAGGVETAMAVRKAMP